jgi:hypothetical protein
MSSSTNTEFKPTYLYIKTHNITGLKYFGKTVSKDPYSYKGSRTRWNNHLKKHGYDISTEILGFYTDKEECYKAAIEFSIANDIVKSNDWANLKIEKLDGGWDHITLEHIKRGHENFRKRPLEEQEAINKKKARKGKDNGMYGRNRSGENNPRFGVSLSQELKDLISTTNKGKTVAVDKDGNKFQVDCHDERFITGEIKHYHHNKIPVVDKDGNRFAIDRNDERVLSGELVHIYNGRKMSEEFSQKMKELHLGNRWYNNGEISKRSKTELGEGWILGRLPFKKK